MKIDQEVINHNQKGEPMRLIDADSVIKTIKGLHSLANIMLGTNSATRNVIDSIVRLIESAPTIEPEPQWIPCSERLPVDRTYVLTTIRVPGRQPHARSGWFEHGLFMNDNGDTWKSTDKEVIAWMPLPEPYEGR